MIGNLALQWYVRSTFELRCTDLRLMLKLSIGSNGGPTKCTETPRHAKFRKSCCVLVPSPRKINTLWEQKNPSLSLFILYIDWSERQWSIFIVMQVLCRSKKPFRISGKEQRSSKQTTEICQTSLKWNIEQNIKVSDWLKRPTWKTRNPHKVRMPHSVLLTG